MAGGELTTLGNQYSDLLGGLVYLNALGDPRNWPASDPANLALLQSLPASIQFSRPTSAKSRSFDGFRASQRRALDFAFPESQLRNTFVTNPDGAMGRFTMPRQIHEAIGAGHKKRAYWKTR